MKDAELAEVLELLTAELDLPPEVDEALTEAYEEVAEWLSADTEASDRVSGVVYAQGSKALGTLVAPVDATADVDVDLVFRRDTSRTNTTQAELKGRVGAQLRRFVAWKQGHSPDAPKLTEGKRCWTLEYRGFHLDVLPAIPNDSEGADADSILITDRKHRLWQVSNPRGYAKWFRMCAGDLFDAARVKLAKARSVEVEAIPEEEVKTVLHLAVQLLKRHRDLCGIEHQPASIIITTLAALAFEHETNLFVAVREALRRFRVLIQKRNGVWWLANPVDPAENFLDRWREKPQLAAGFFAWLDAAERDFDALALATGIDVLNKSMSDAFGEDVATQTTRRLGEKRRKQREEGRLRITSSGTLGAVGSVVEPHTFYGD